MIGDLVALFGAGVASFLAPCLVPLLPAYLGMVVGEAAEAGDPARAVPATVIFVLGFAAVFTLLGTLAGLIGGSLASVEDGIQRVGGAVVIVMGSGSWQLVPGNSVEEIDDAALQ